MAFDPRAVLPLLAEVGIAPESPMRTFPSAASVTEAFRALFDIAASERREET